MECKKQLSLAILLVALLGGIIGRYLFLGVDVGLNLTLYFCLLIAALLGFCYWLQINIPRVYRGLLGFAVFLALSFAVRDSEAVIVFNLLGLGLIGVICLALVHKDNIYQLYVVRLVLCGLKMLFMPILALSKIVPDALSPLEAVVKDSRMGSVGKGLLWALPLLFIFGRLLVSSDVRFADFAGGLIDFDIFALSESLVVGGLWGLATLGFLFGALIFKAAPAKTVEGEKSGFFDGIQLITMLACINLLFCCYIVIQFTYFFGGDALVHNIKGLTYSAYARKGFWELVLVAMIALPLLYLADCMQQGESQKLRQVFRVLSFFTIGAIFIMECSAAHRMALYVREYQLTELRFYSSWYMGFIVSALITFVATVLRGKREKFIINSAFCALGFIALLNVMNPEAVIARYNLAQIEQGRSIDQNYLIGLGNDAYPVIIEYAQSHPEFDFCQMVWPLRTNFSRHWQSWSWGDHRAKSDWQGYPKVEDCIDKAKGIKRGPVDDVR